MRLLCLFDMPMTTSEEKREYRDFRKKLLSQGFIMIQYSVYSRACPNREFSKKFIPKLRDFTPSSGNVRLLFVTEKQYNDMMFIVGKKNKQEELLSDNKLVVI